MARAVQEFIAFLPDLHGCHPVLPRQRNLDCRSRWHLEGRSRIGLNMHWAAFLEQMEGTIYAVLCGLPACGWSQDFAEAVVRLTLRNLNVVMPWPEQHKFRFCLAEPAWLSHIASALVVWAVSAQLLAAHLQLSDLLLPQRQPAVCFLFRKCSPRASLFSECFWL